MIGHLNVRDQKIEEFPLLGLPDHLLVQQLTAARPQQLDHAGPMFEVVPEPLGVEQLQFVFLVPRQVAQPPIVEQQPPVLVDNAHRGRTVFQDFVKLPLLFLDLMLVPRERGDVVDPEHALAADEADMPARVGDLHVGQQHVKGWPFLVRQTTFSFSSCPPRSRNDAMIRERCSTVVPEYAGIDAVEFFLAVAEQLAQPRVVEQQPPVVVDDHQRRRTELQQFAELALVLRRLDPPSRAAIRCHQSACCRVRRHSFSAGLTSPFHSITPSACCCRIKARSSPSVLVS